MKKANCVLIENGYLLSMDPIVGNIDAGWLYIEGNHIVGVGEPPVPNAYRYRADTILDASNKVVSPGFVNGHTHLSQVLMRGLLIDQSLSQALHAVIRPFQAALTPQDTEIACTVGLMENLRSGITSVVQHHKITNSPEHVNVAAEAARKTGIRLLLSRGWRDAGIWAEDPQRAIDEILQLKRRWSGALAGKLSVGFGPMAPWLCSTAAMVRVLPIIREHDLTTHIHVAETKEEVDLFVANNGERPIEWLRRIGFLNAKTQLVHTVWINDREMEMIAESRATVVHCPVSNTYLGCGLAPIRKMLDKGITVAIGTDGPATGNAQSILENMRLAYYLARQFSQNGLAIEEVLRMATMSGSCLFPSAKIGCLQVGAEADVVIRKQNTLSSVPATFPDRALLFSSEDSDVDTVIVGGDILIKNGRFVRLEELRMIDQLREVSSKLVWKIQHEPKYESVP